MGGKVYELNGEEQSILEDKCLDLCSITKKKILRQDLIKVAESEIGMLQSQQRDIIGYMAERFGLTRIQVINKVLYENRKDK